MPEVLKPCNGENMMLYKIDEMVVHQVVRISMHQCLMSIVDGRFQELALFEMTG